MTDFAVTVSAVLQASAAVRRVGCDLDAELRLIRRDADRLLCGQWSGRAADSFEQAWTGWDQGAREVVAALDELADLLATSGHAYAAQDEAGSQQLWLAAS